MNYAVSGGSSTGSWTTPMVRGLLWANGIMFLARLFTAKWLPWDSVLLVPADAVGRLHLWQVFTYMYIHIDLMHLLANLFGLFIFGPDVERLFGPRRFFYYYTACGFGAALTACVAYPHGTILGASGAIYGVLLAFALLFPYRPVYLFGVAPIEARWLAVMYGVIDLVGGIQGGGGVAHLAHLGGLGTGLLIFILMGQMKISIGNAGVSSARSAGPSLIRRWTDKVQNKVDQRKAEKKRMTAEELDAILDKIAKSGMSSLTKSERSMLKSASSEMRKPGE